MRWNLPSSLALLALISACTSSPAGDDAGTKKTPPNPPLEVVFDVVTLDPKTSEPMPLSLSIHDDRVGVAYFVSTDAGVPSVDGGTSVMNYDLRYIEWAAGQTKPFERVDTVQRVSGVSLDFRANGEPAVAYLGGGSDQSVFWLQSDAVLSRRSGSSWTSEVVTQTGDQANCGSPVSDRGFLVGLNPALVIEGNTTFLAYRDGHDGQYPQQDWAGSDLEVAVSTGGGWTRGCAAAGGDQKDAYGGHISMTFAEGQPVLVHDRVYGSADNSGQDVLFQRRKPDGSWTTPQSVHPVGNGQSGPSLAYDPVAKYGVAVVERSENKLLYISSEDGAQWSAPDPVFQIGTGGWYPSLAFDPVNHEPAIAFYICAANAGVAEGNCPADQDELRVAQLIGGTWREGLVDAEGGYLPKVGFLSSGKRVVAYRDPRSGSLKLAVEQ